MRGMRFLIDGKIIKTKGIVINGKLVSRGRRGAMLEFYKKSCEDFVENFKMNELKELLEPI